jgi:hypothetical protein
MLKLVAMLFVLAVLAVVVLALRKPATIRIVRSAEIGASPAAVYAQIADLRTFNRWNPWAKMDPAIRLDYAGPAAGVGAISSWESAKVGTGRMEITEATPSSRVAMRLDFIKPFAATNGASFTLTERGSRTEVVWEMHGPSSFLQRVMSVFIDMEKMMGKNFEDGLADLRRQAEA